MAQFATIVESLPRQRDWKRNSRPYIGATWGAALREPRGTTGPTKAELSALDARVNDADLQVLAPRALYLLRWLAREVAERRSWSVIPGVEKLGEVLGVSKSGAHRYLTMLKDEGLLTTTRRGLGRAMAIDLRPLLPATSDPLTEVASAPSNEEPPRAPELRNID